jgi:hypothetical protein
VVVVVVELVKRVLQHRPLTVAPGAAVTAYLQALLDQR